MASFDEYPTWQDVELKLKSIAVWPTDATKQLLAREQAAIGAGAVVDEFERRTGWKPYLADSEDSTWSFDRLDPYGELDLEGGFVSITSVTINGTLQTLNTNYTTEPRNATGLGVPITRLHWPYGGYRHVYPTTPNGIVVVGKRGAVTTLARQRDVWQALQEAAALIALTSVENFQSIASLSMDGFSKAYDVVGIITSKDLLTTWSKGFDKKCAQCSRIQV